MELNEFREKFFRIQQGLKCEKGQSNDFGHYKYRSCADILAALKPLLAQEGLTVILNDELVHEDERYYIKATAILQDFEGHEAKASALAREAFEKKGMDCSQISGTASSYARKYALGGLFAIDDTKDADALPPDRTDGSITGNQLEIINNFPDKTKKWLEDYFKTNIENMTRDEATEAIRLVNNARKKKEADGNA